MGQFSWLYSDTGNQMLDNVEHNSFLLVPKEYKNEFGNSIVEHCYDGYGRMGGYDIYDLVMYFNKEDIALNPDRVTHSHSGQAYKHYVWYPVICELQDVKNFNEFKARYDELMEKVDIPNMWGKELRIAGIDIACYDEDNASLENPIKIVEDKLYTFDEVGPSESDPNQGWYYYDDEDEDDFLIPDEEDMQTY